MAPHALSLSASATRAGLRVERLSLPAVAGGLAVAAPLVAALALAHLAGGYFLPERGVVAIALCGLVAAAVLLPGATAAGPAGLVAIGALPALALWQVSSRAWADEPAAATTTASLTMLYAAVVALTVVGVRSTAWLPRVLAGAVAVTTVVAGSALGARLLPGVVDGDVDARLSAPLTYWNSLGVLMAFGAVVAIGVAADHTRSLGLRVACATVVPMHLLAALLTLSRGALVALAVGLVALVALYRRRVDAAAGSLGLLVVAMPLLVTVAATPALIGVTGPLPPHASEGAWATAGLALTMGASAAIPLLLTRLPRPGTRSRRRLAAGLATCAVLGVVAVVLATVPQGGPITWASDRVEAFQSADSAARSGGASAAESLGAAAGTGRWQNWSVAGEQFTSAPLVGTGAGDYRLHWAQERPIDLFVRNAHSLYLETLGESGLVGLALLLAPVLAGGALILRARRTESEGALGASFAVAAAGVLTVVLHAGIDWDWQVPAAVLPAAVVGGAAVKAAALASSRHERPLGVPVAVALALAFIAGAALLAGPTGAAARTEQAADLAAAGRLDSALAAVRDARRLWGESPSAALLEAQILSDLGRPRAADRAYADALARSPKDAAIATDWAGSLLARGDRASAVALLRRVRELDPRSDRAALLRLEAAASR